MHKLWPVIVVVVMPRSGMGVHVVFNRIELVEAIRDMLPMSENRSVSIRMPKSEWENDDWGDHRMVTVNRGGQHGVGL